MPDMIRDVIRVGDGIRLHYRRQGQGRPIVLLPRCERVEGRAIPNCGHFIAEEQPQALVEAIVKFVR
jgi:pimeloyl-ACP methyl ester carboxylesterase